MIMNGTTLSCVPAQNYEVVFTVALVNKVPGVTVFRQRCQCLIKHAYNNIISRVVLNPVNSTLSLVNVT